MSADHSRYLLCFHKESAAALLLSEEPDSEPFWLPRSLAPYLRKTGEKKKGLDVWEVEIPDWKADKLDLKMPP